MLLKLARKYLMKSLYIKSLINIITFMFVFSLSVHAQETKDYAAVLKSADEYYQKKDYYNAKATYQLAVKLKPTETYPQEKIQEIIDILKAEMAVRGEYDEYIEMADEAFKQKDYQTAISNYEKALQLIAYEAHPNDRLAESKQLLDASNLKKSIYEEAIKTADQHFAKQEYEKAISFYRDAANVDDSQKYPNDQILKINQILKSQASSQQAYEQAILQADQQLNYQKFAEALAKYELALVSKPADNYATQQVAKMKVFITKEKEYDAITKTADELYVSQDLAAAKAQYQKAIDILPEKTYALNMIAKIDANLNKEQAKILKLEEDYQKAINEGDQLFKDQKYQSAFSKYSKALELKPNEAYPKSQLEEIDILLATGYIEIACFVHENNKGLFDARIQLKEGNRVIETAEIGTNGRHKFKLDLNKEYQIRFFKSDYVQKIFDVNTALPRDVNHNNIYEYELIVELFPECGADLSILDRPLTEISYFKDKGNFYIDEQRAQIVINQVNNLKKECEEIRAQEKQEEDYTKLIASADKSFGQKKYSDALENYSAASMLLPNKEYPKEKISEIQQLLETIDKYQALISSGDAKYNAKDYENALYDYYAAKNMKPTEPYPQEKINEIDVILNAQKELNARYDAQVKQADSLYSLDSLNMAIDSYELALKIKENEAYPKDKIAEIRNLIDKQDEINKRYQDAIANADKLFEKESFKDAIAAYTVASQIKPNEMYPKYKIEDINTIEEQRRMRALNSNYDGMIEQADVAFEAKKYEQALSLYQGASDIKPKETYPPAQIELIDGILARIAADQEQYNSIIAQADQEFIAKTYAPSFDNYKLASQMKPEESYPKERMAEIEAIMKELADLEVAYQEAVRQGDEQFELSSWTNALTFYQKAGGLKPAETYPPQKIAEINGILEGMANQDAAYNAAIAEGDRQFGIEEWGNALSSYEKALGIKANEAYPKNQIAIINTKLSELAQLQAQYDELIATADQLFSSQTYQDAKTTYQQALELKPNEAYPPQKIAEIDALLQAVADKDAAYASAIAKADQEFEAEDWNTSKSTYELALGIKPNEQYPPAQIALIDQKLADIAQAAAAFEAQYQSLITEADGLFDAQKLTDSKAKYQEAGTLKPNETYPPQRIAEIDALLQAMADKDAAYAMAIEKADRYFGESQWEMSLTAYQNALEIKQEEQYPKDRIAEINLKLQEIAAIKAQYDALIVQADASFAQQDYLPSKSSYQQALNIFPEEVYPQQKIAEIDALLQQMADQDALYQQLIQSGDVQLAEKSYNPALSSYKQALAIKSSEQYPKDKIAEIENILLSLAEQDRLYSEAIAQADQNRDQEVYEAALGKYEEASTIKPNEAYPKEQIALIQQKLKDIAAIQVAYDQAIAQADQKFESKEWQASLGFYNEALGLKASEVYPQTQIQEINRILKEIADQDAAYKLAIEEADGFYKSKNWSPALTKYEMATQIKPNEQYPKDKIAELNGILGDLAAQQAKYDALIAEADQFYTATNYASAVDSYKAALEIKPGEEYPTSQLQKIDQILAELAEIQRQFDAFVKDGDKQFVKEEWSLAKTSYEQALQLKSEEIYPKEQINIIDGKLQAIADRKAQYEALIAEADQLFGAATYETAMLKYEAASNILTEEVYPKDQMKKIRELMEELAQKNAEYDKIIAKADDYLLQESFEKSKEQYQLASEIFTDRPYPKEQIVKIDALIVKHTQYQEFVATGDEQFKNKEYDEALVSFNKARTLLPEKEYPGKKITEIESILQMIAMTRAAYDAAILKADAQLAATEYNLAKESYQEALDQISTEVYPRQKIMEIDQILQDMARKKVQFDKIIAQANKAFDEKSYDMALGKYKEALTILPEEVYPQERITEIEGILAQMANQQERYESLIAQGDQAINTQEYKPAIDLFTQAQAIYPHETYPPQKIAEAQAALEKIQRELDVAYQKAIDQADRSFRKRDWDPAKQNYLQASDIKPEELYPREKLAEINSILEKQLLEQQKEYDRHIADGERFYGTKYYQEAILSFERALTVFPFEKYPSEMIDKIFELIKKTSMVTLLDSKMTIAQNNEEKFKFNTIAFKDRSENYILLEVKMVNPEAQVKLFVNFGKGGAQNGGYSIPLKTRDGYHSYFVSIGKQVRWVNQDNDYISLLPEGGDVEVKLIKISRNGI